MKLRELFDRNIDEMSMVIDPVKNTKLDHPVSNHSLFMAYKPKLSMIEKLGDNITLYYCDRGSREAYLAVYSEGNPNDEQIAYIMEYERTNSSLIGAYVTQKWLWTNPKYRHLLGDLPTRVFFELIDDYFTVTADSEQTPEGKNFWKRKLTQAFGKGLNVYLVNFDNNKLIKLNTPTDINKTDFSHGVWTKSESSLEKVFVISSKKLTTKNIPPKQIGISHKPFTPDTVVDEAPLPDEWDKTVFTPQNSYKRRIDYAVARAQKMGKGSSRTAFTIEFDGRPTILKVAHNAKGMAQNEAEASILSDPQVPRIVIPIIDYDEEHNQPVWIHTEQAVKATEKTLCNIMKCGTLKNLVTLAGIDSGYDNYGKYPYSQVLNNIRLKYKLSDDDVDTLEEYVNDLSNLYSGFDIELIDFTRAANWGLYNGQPVVIDIGYTTDVRAAHYHRPGF